MEVSVIMSTYNEKIEYIKEAIRSILNQSYSEFEFIIVNDNPKRDDLKKFLKEYSLEDSRIKIISNETNIGLANSLNRALEIAQGEFIFRMDADDISKKDRFEKQLNFMRENNLDFSATLMEIIDETGKVERVQRNHKNQIGKVVEKQLKYRSIMSHPSWCVKREIYNKLKGYKDIVPVEDYDFVLRAVNLGCRMGITKDVLISYRINRNGISQSNLYKQQLAAFVLQDKMRADCSKEELDKGIKKYSSIKGNDENHFKLYINLKNRKKIVSLLKLSFESYMARRLLKNDLMVPLLKILF